ncbi:MAG: isoprenylcysteine carboxylmethyltransferase family protein [Chloroflexi bacterium]|nr:isoprenylcysteine carboxylmethyltransferase family protein [Chloroflexota bacterium]
MDFHQAFIGVIGAFAAVRVYFNTRARLGRGRVEYREGERHKIVRIVLGVGYMTAIVAYLIDPSLFAFMAFPLPDEIRILGLLLSLVGLAFLAWVHHHLGVNFSARLHLRQEHELITSGPYHRVRHPMYTAFYLSLLGWLLLSANFVIGGLGLLGVTAVVVNRVAREEATMRERFGATYDAYLARTRRFVPGLL